MSEETFVCTACPGWGDHEYCALKTVVKDGKILRTERLDYTGPESEEGYICQKGVAAARQPYNPNRVQGPMKRVGARGEGKWERISWNQALDEIAEKLLELRDRYGADSVALWNLLASVPPTFGLHNLMMARFRNVWGGVDPVFQYGIDDGPVYAIDYMFGMGSPAMYMLTSLFNFDASNLIIVWGANPVENQQRVVNHLIAARENGAKIVDVGLIYDGTADYACDHPALSGDFKIDGVECWTEWDANVAEWSKYTLEHVEQVTGVSPAVLRQLAYEYSHCDGKAYIIGALGLRYMNAGEAYRTFYTLAALTGQLGYPGAGVTSALMTTEHPAVLNDEPIKNPFLAEPEKCKARNVKLVDFFTGLAQRVGLGEHFDKTTEEWNAMRLQLRFDYPPNTASARIELYSETLYKVGHQVAVCEPPYETSGDEKYPFQFFTGRQRFFM